MAQQRNKTSEPTAIKFCWLVTSARGSPIHTPVRSNKNKKLQSLPNCQSNWGHVGWKPSCHCYLHQRGYVITSVCVSVIQSIILWARLLKK